MAPERVAAAESKVATRVGAAAAVTRTEAASRTMAASGQSPEGTRTEWVKASIGGLSRAAVGVASGAEAQVMGMAVAVMGTTEAVTMLRATRVKVAKGVAGTEGPSRGCCLQRC